MDNIKRSVTNFIKHRPQQGRSIHNTSMATNENNEDSKSASTKFDGINVSTINRPQDDNRKLPFNNPHREKEIMDSIDTVYFCDGNVDCSDYELKRLADLTDLNKINERRKCMKEQLAVTTKKIFNYILENYPSYSAELTKVMELQELIQKAYVVCQQSRRHLGRTESVLTVAAFSSISKHRKRQRILATLEILAKIKMMQTTDVQICRMLEEEDVVNAIRLCIECKKVAELYKEYACISDLSTKLQTTLIDIEDRLDNMLATCTVNFESERFNRATAAYSILNRIQVIPGKIADLVQCAIEDTFSSVAIKYLNDKTVDTSSDDKLQYFIALCKALDIDSVLRCYSEMLRLAWQIMYSYHCFIWWTTEQAVSEVQELNQLLNEKLMNNLSSVWENVGFRLTLLMDNVTDLTAMKFTDFVEFLRLAGKFIEIGAKHFSCRSSRLQDAVRRLSLKYLDWHHKACLFELKQFLSTERWEPVPVKRHFTYKNLPEFAFVKNLKPSSFGFYVPDDKQQLVLMNPSFLNPFSSQHFDNSLLDEPNAGEDDYSDDSDPSAHGIERRDVDLHKRPPYQNNNHDEAPLSFKAVAKMPPFISNSCLNLLRLIGKYMEIAWIFSPISFEVISMLMQLFEYYLHAVITLCTHKGHNAVFGHFANYSSNKLQSLLSKLEQQYANAAQDDLNISPLSDNINGVSTSNCHIQLSRRIVAVESTIYASKQLQSLQTIVHSVLPTNRTSFYEQFYSQVVACTEDIRFPVYAQFCFSSIKWRFLLSAIEATSWDIQDLMSQYSSYVSSIVEEFESFKRIVAQTNSTTITVPKEAYDTLLICWVRAIMKLLVEGYSSAKKCTNQGRALMQLDFQNLLLQLEKRTSLKPIPDKDLVDTYVKAYYLPESSIEDNITTNAWNEYSQRQLIGLINVTSQLTKKTRLKLLAILENMDSTNAAREKL